MHWHTHRNTHVIHILKCYPPLVISPGLTVELVYALMCACWTVNARYGKYYLGIQTPCNLSSRNSTLCVTQHLLTDFICSLISWKWTLENKFVSIPLLNNFIHVCNEISPFSSLQVTPDLFDILPFQHDDYSALFPISFCLSVYLLSPTSVILMYVGVGSCTGSWANIKRDSPKEKRVFFPQQLSVSKAPQWEVGYSFPSTLEFWLAWSHLELRQISTAAMSSWIGKPYCVRRQLFSMSSISSSTALPETWEDGCSFRYNIRWSPERNLMHYIHVWHCHAINW